MNRPADFDRLLVCAIPRLMKYARRATATAEDAENAMSDMVEAVLANWKSYRPEGNFEKWCKLTIRSKARDRRTSVANRFEHIDVDETVIALPASQEAAAIASSIISKLASIDGGEEMMLFAMGHSQPEVGKLKGVTGARVCQRIKAVRAALLEAA